MDSGQLAFNNDDSNMAQAQIRPCVDIPLSNTILGQEGEGVSTSPWKLFDE